MRTLTFTLILLVAFVFSACQKGTVGNNASTTAKRYPLKGKVISVDKAAKKAKVAHEKIDGYMEPMEMDFPIHADWVWEDLLPGVEIRAELVVDNTAKDPYWLENIGIVASPAPGQNAPPINENFAQIGKPVPDFTLTNQDGKPVSFKSFKGKALAITFIYAQCPLPDFCIKMSTNFSDAAKLIMADPAAKENIRLLSISFDPARDTPEKLRSYGLGYMGKDAKPDFSVWQLAVGKDAEVRKIADFFGLQYQVDENDKTQFNHSLRTAIIGPDGNVTKIIPGNEWKAGDLIRELNAALDPKP
ncbi:MAG: SCO family protein [Pyrinomonadaceae bacterium]|nr:SCO family protein [Pyrinomonadaceae bacterium]MBP6213324.1 SCO family protein [Pyrinomonadaceae bacterium]